MIKFLLAAILALGTTTMASAAVEMTTNQLDQVTAGGTFKYTDNLSVSGTITVGNVTVDHTGHFEVSFP